MKNLLFILSVCCLLYSCNDHVALPQDKIPLLKNNDMACFQDSASSKVDTFILDVRNIWHQDTEGDYLQYIEIYYNKLNSKETLFFISIGPSGTGGDFSIFSSQSEFGYSFTVTNYIIHGITYPNVYTAHLSNDTIPNTVYFTYPNGIIRCEYQDGRVYQLISK